MTTDHPTGPPCGNNPNHPMSDGDRAAVEEFRTYLAERAAELLTHATVFEIPRPGNALPLQIRRSHGYTDRWAICDRTGRRWDREYGWVCEDDGIRYEAQRDATRYTLREAMELGHKLAEEPQP